MMHSTLHFALGMLVGSGLSCQSIRRALKQNAPLAAPLRRWLFLAYGLGVLAIVPNLLRRAGVPHDICEAWFMNIFLLSPLLNHFVQGATIYGPFFMSLLVASFYAMLLLAVRRAKHTQY